MARSTDNGATWSAAAALNSNAASDSGYDQNPQVSTDGAGNWVAVWESADSLGGLASYGVNDIFYAAGSICGDGFVAATEQCDDSGTNAGDGCDASCQLEAGYECPTPGVACNDIDECALETADANTTAIQITANNVTLDLNGFVISGPAVCTHTPFTTCTNTGNGLGIAADGVEGTVIKDGTVSGMGGGGIAISSGRIERVRVIGNGGGGIFQSGGGLYGDGDLRIIDCSVSLNDGIGIHLEGGIVSGSVANLNGDSAIQVTGPGAVIVNNYLEENDQGVEIGGGGAVVSGNAALGNYGTGFMVVGSIMNNVAECNGSGGINSGGGSTLVANSVQGNTGLGLSMGSTDGYALNVAVNNNGGEPNPQMNSGLETGSNVCGVDLTCP